MGIRMVHFRSATRPEASPLAGRPR